jgi:putative endopeptidase
MRFRALATSACLLAFVLLALAQDAPQKPGQANPIAVEEKRPLTSLPYTPSLDVTAMDKTADPCADFYAYSCGGWVKKNPIPPDQASWSVYGKLTNENQMFLWGILDEATRLQKRTPTQQKIGDMFASCMDESAVEKLGATPLQNILTAITGMTSTKDLPAVLARLHMATGSSGLMFGFGSNQDFGDSTQVIAFATAGGLGLPDRDYYLKDDAKSKEIRGKYVAHLERMFQLLGDSADAGKTNAQTVMKIETSLAKASLTRVERRDPYKQYHKMSRAELQALTPSFDWNAYLAGIGAAGVTTLNVTQPEFYKQWEQNLQHESLDNIKTYLRWQLARTSSPFLSSTFVQADFDFYSRTLRGVQQMRPRWKRCVQLVDRTLGEALGQEFVNRTFSPDMKKRTVEMTRQIEKAMEDDINQLSWMGPETKKQALEKLHSVVNKVGYPDRWRDSVVNKVGYPDRWRDYSSVNIVRGDLVGNVQRATKFEESRQLAKIGRPVERFEWGMTPPTVNAYYNPQMNDINFPAGVLQPPLYDFKLDDAPNYGNTGSTIGHELTHGFDDEGRKFDAKGNLKDWWTKQDGEEFEKRAACVSDQYATYVVVDDIHINSKLTLGEDVADLGGTILAWVAWKEANRGKTLKSVEGFTPEQRFFVGLAQWACENQRPENQRVNAITDPHSPGKYRINGVVVNMPEFQQAFSCKTGQPMAPANRCRVW